MIFHFQTLNTISCKLKAKKLNSGMTYVEIIVVLSIFAVMTSIILFNYKGFQAKVDIKNLASDIALKIVEAQKSSLDGKWNSGAPADWKPSYGVYFNSSTAFDVTDNNIPFNQKFIYFTDVNDPINGSYDGVSSCSSECLDKITITKNNFISGIDICNSANCNLGSNPIASLSITFKRPDYRANFSDPTVTGSDYVQITI